MLARATKKRGSKDVATPMGKRSRNKAQDDAARRRKRSRKEAQAQQDAATKAKLMVQWEKHAAPIVRKTIDKNKHRPFRRAKLKEIVRESNRFSEHQIWLVRIYAYGSAKLSQWDMEDSRLVHYEKRHKPELKLYYCTFKFGRTDDPNRPPQYYFEDTFALQRELRDTLETIPLPKD